MMPAVGLRLGRAIWSVWLQPRRLLGSSICTIAVAASAVTVRMLAPPIGASLLGMVYGGIIAFNLGLFLPFGTLTRSPLRVGAALLVNLLPLSLAPLLYAASPVLADACLIVAAALSVLARPLGSPVNAFALLATLNLLMPLVLGGELGLAPLGALAAVIGTVFAVAADLVITRLLWPRTVEWERWALRCELAAFFTDLRRLWRSGEILNDPNLRARIARLHGLRDEITPFLQQRGVMLPLDSMLEAVIRSAAQLRSGTGALSEADNAVVEHSLAALADAARPDSADGGADQAIEAMRRASLRRPAPGEPIPPPRMFGFALLLSDLVAAALPRRAPSVAALPPTMPAARWPAALSGVQIRLALQCAVSLLIACVVMRLLPFPRPYWLALTALIVTANSFGETAAKSLERITGTILGLLAGTLVWMAVAGTPKVAIAILIAAVFALFYERAAQYRTMLFWLSLLLSLLFHLADASDTVYVARLVDTLIGTAIAVMVTMVLLPVRTGDEVRDQMAALLDLAAAKLRRLASSLALSGPRPRGGEVADALDAAEKLSGLTAAEGVEATLLRRPRLSVRQRIAATAQLARCLLYIDQLIPLLPGAEPSVPGALLAVGAEIAGLAGAIRTGAAPPRLDSAADITRLHDGAAGAYHAGRIGLDQFQACLRLDEALAVLAIASGELARSAPATPARMGSAGFSAAGD